MEEDKKKHTKPAAGSTGKRAAASEAQTSPLRETGEDLKKETASAVEEQFIAEYAALRTELDQALDKAKENENGWLRRTGMMLATSRGPGDRGSSPSSA